MIVARRQVLVNLANALFYDVVVIKDPFCRIRKCDLLLWSLGELHIRFLQYVSILLNLLRERRWVRRPGACAKIDPGMRRSCFTGLLFQRRIGVTLM